MLDYAAIQRETVERLRTFNAASTAQAVGQRLRDISASGPVVCLATWHRASAGGYWHKHINRVKIAPDHV